MTLYLSKLVEDELWRWAREYPAIEVCGFVDLNRQMVWPVGNVSPAPASYFIGDPEDTMRALRMIRRPFAVYHSHPTRNAEPSEHDVASARYGLAIILSLRYAELKAYRVQGGAWTEVAVSQHESGVQA